MMSMADPIAIGVETLRIDSGCSLEKEFIELIRMNPDETKPWGRRFHAVSHQKLFQTYQF